MTERQKPFDSRGIPLANFFDIHFCGHCPNAHLIFYDNENKPIAHATMTAAQARSVEQSIEAKDPNFREQP
jgi:hypothetical protein